MMRRSWENYGVKLEFAKRDLAERGGGGSTPLSAKVGNATIARGLLPTLVDCSTNALLMNAQPATVNLMQFVRIT